MRRRPATGLMAVGLARFCAGVNDGRAPTAMGHDAAAVAGRRPAQAALCRSRRRCAASTAVGVRAAGGPVPRLDASRRGERVHTHACAWPAWARAHGERLRCSGEQASVRSRAAGSGERWRGASGADGAVRPARACASAAGRPWWARALLGSPRRGVRLGAQESGVGAGPGARAASGTRGRARERGRAEGGERAGREREEEERKKKREKGKWKKMGKGKKKEGREK